MVRIRGNWLLLQIVVTYAAFWIFALVAEKEWLASLVAILAGISGIALAIRYVPKSVSILFKMERGTYGAHNAVFGVAEVGIGMVWMAVYMATWWGLGRPPHWIGSGAALFGLFLVAKGFLRVAVSPSTIGEDYKLPDNLVNAGALIFAIIAGVVLGKMLP